MEWAAVGVNAAVAVAIGIALWAFLPRGAILTRQMRPDLVEAWQITNSGPVPIRLTSVRVLGPGIDEDLFWDGSHGVSMELSDETDDIARTDFQRPWDEVTVAPGDTLHATLDINTSLRIRYRRAGWSGVLERRSIIIHGSV